MERDLSVVGCLGVLAIGTRGQDGPGEVLVKISGGSESYLAWSDRPLPRGTTVLVVESRGARSVLVSAWPDNSPPPGPAAVRDAGEDGDHPTPSE
jgi:hypothetical protein